MFPAGYAHDYPTVHRSKVYRAYNQAMCRTEFKTATEASFGLIQAIIDEHGPNVHLKDDNRSESLLSHVITMTLPFYQRNEDEMKKTLDLIRYIIHAGASVSPGPLIGAAHIGDPMVLAELLQYCDDPDDHIPEPENGYTALCSVVVTGGYWLSRTTPKGGPVYQARLRECAKCIALLINHGADVQCMGSSTRSAWLECQDPDHPLRHLIIPGAKSAHA